MPRKKGSTNKKPSKNVRGREGKKSNGRKNKRKGGNMDDEDQSTVRGVGSKERREYEHIKESAKK